MRSHLTWIVLLLCGHMCLAQTKPLTSKQINKLLPEKIKGFFTKKSKATELSVGNISYALAEREFGIRKRNVKILLFDYANAEVMFTQSVARWNAMRPIESDSVAFRKNDCPDGECWESFTRHNSRAQIMATVFKRYVITLDAEHVSLEELHDIFAKLGTDKFPR